MPNWWLIWAEQLARVLAEWWLRSRADASGEPRPDTDAEPPPDISRQPDDE